MGGGDKPRKAGSSVAASAAVGAKKKKTSEAEKRAARAQRQAKKRGKADERNSRRAATTGGGGDDEEEEEDIDAILEQIRLQDEARAASVCMIVIPLVSDTLCSPLSAGVAITEEQCDPPSRRSCGAFVANPVNLAEIVMFGGEAYDGQRVTVFNDLLVYNVEKDAWRRIQSPTTPPPRSSHQLVVTPAGRGFLFGGEFTSPNQTTFFHYKDFWSLDFKTYAWEKIEAGKGKWHALDVPEPKPTKRSGFSLCVNGDVIILYGGYTKETVKGGQPKGVVHSGNGGVVDVKEDDENIDSVCLDELFQYNIDQGRFYPVVTRNKNPNEREKRPFGGVQERDEKEVTFADLWTIDLDKVNGFSCIVQDESADASWLGKESDSDDDDDGDYDESEDELDDDGDDGEGEDGDNDGDEQTETIQKSDDKPQKPDDNPEASSKKARRKGKGPEVLPAADTAAAVSSTDVPDPSVAAVEPAADPGAGEVPAVNDCMPRGTDASLRDYFARTTDYWFGEALKALELAGESGGGKGSTNAKAVRRQAFVLAEEMWGASAERLAEERRILEENEVQAAEATRKAASEKRGRRF
ncbi:hypothetical protein HK405_005804 [Cladochytrium tenue]|nr:hypothetical protein HK405_005804 [Cladochytrium tenue]